MSSEYYSLEKAAEVLGLPTGEITRLRERNQLRAFRDGSSWKFRKVDVDNFLAETIKNRGKQQKSSDSDFDLLGNDDEEETPTLLADSASFDALMEDGDGLSLADDMIDAAPQSQPSKVELSKRKKSADNELSLADDGLSLADEADVDLALDEDHAPSKGSGSSAKLNLASDSGLSLLDAADDIELEPVSKGGSDAILELDDDDDILSLVDAENAENTSTIAIPVEDDFQLTPSEGSVTDDSESASQVIALEDDNMFGPALSGAVQESPFGAAPASPQSAPFSSAPAGEFAPQPVYAAPTSVEANYGVVWVIGFISCAILLFIAGCMGLDLIINIWSWKEPFVINSTLMDLVAGMAGLK